LNGEFRRLSQPSLCCIALHCQLHLVQQCSAVQEGRGGYSLHNHAGVTGGARRILRPARRWAAHWPLCTVSCTLATVYCVLYTGHCVLCTVHWVLCTVYCTLATVYCVLCTGHCALCTVYCTQATVHGHHPQYKQYMAEPSVLVRCSEQTQELPHCVLPLLKGPP
jgi:hypothetical protein